MLEKLKDFKIVQVVIAVASSVVAFLLGLLAISEYKRKKSDESNVELKNENIELKVENEVNSKPITDIVNEFNSKRRPDNK